MKQHIYRVTLEHVQDAAGQAVDRPPLVFSARNHDDLFAIVERMRNRPDLSPEDATCLAVGLKLLGEVVLEHRKDPLFEDLMGAIGAFIKRLKAGM